MIVSAGFYGVMWGQAKESNKLLVVTEEDLFVANEPGSSDQKASLLSSVNEFNSNLL